jgi:5S rRNA maturation endonuclease (ribonuclease M5)
VRRRGWIRTGKGGDGPDRLRQLEHAIERLREEAEYGTVVVEGARDLSALEWLGIGGLHVLVNRGRPLGNVIEELVQSPPPVVLLVDWDRTGGRLLHVLEDGLRSRVQLDTACRRRIAAAAQCKCLEELPAELSALRDAG